MNILVKTITLLEHLIYYLNCGEYILWPFGQTARSRDQLTLTGVESYYYIVQDVNFPAGTSLLKLCLSSFQVRYPDRITLIRGNHESRQITQVRIK